MSRERIRCRRHFSRWRNVSVIEGAIPETLLAGASARVAYLHLDMNCSPPEVAALEYFWERLVAGALVLLDDYAYHGYRSQKLAMDRFAQAKRVPILSLPTGQGLLIKPAGAAAIGIRSDWTSRLTLPSSTAARCVVASASTPKRFYGRN